MKYYKVTTLTVLILIVASLQNAYSDNDKPQTQPSQLDTDKLVDKYLEYIETYVLVDDYDDYNKELVDEDNFFKARFELIRLGEKAVPRLIERLKQVKTNDWIYEYDDEDLEELDEFYYELLPEILGKIGKPAYPYVLVMLKDDELYIRKHAIEILNNNREIPLSMLNPILQSASFDYESLFKEIAKSYDSEYEVDEYYFGELEEYYIGELDWTIMRIHDSKPKDFLEALKNGDDYVKFASLYVLNNEAEYSIFDKETISVIRSLANHKNAYIKQYAIELLGEFAEPEDIPLFLQELSNDVTDYSAFCSLYSYKPELVVSEMFKLLNSKNESSEFSFSNKYVVEYFTDKASSKVLPYIIPLLQKDNSSNDYLKLVSDAIVNCADKTSIPEFEELLISNDKLSVATAIKAMTKLDVGTIKDRVLLLLDDKNNSIREAVVTWLVKFGSIDQLEFLLNSLNDESENIRANVVLALSSIYDERVKPAFLKAIKDESVKVKTNVCLAMMKLNDKDFVPSISKLVTDSIIVVYHLELFQTAVDALIKLEGIEVMPKLGEILKSKSCYYETEDFINEKIVQILSDTKFDESKKLEGIYSILKIVSKSGVERKTEFILNLLKEHKSKDFLKALHQALLNSRSDSAKLLLKKISEFSDKSSLDILLKYSETAQLYDRSQLRVLLADTIHSFSDKNDVSKLLDYIEAGKTNLKNELMDIVCKLGGKQYLSSIKDLLKNDLLWVRIVAINGYSKLTDEPVPFLQELFKNKENFEVKLYIAGNIIKYSKSPDPIYEEYIVECIRKEDYQSSAFEMIERLELRSLTKHVLNLLQTLDQFTLNDVISSLGFKGNKEALPFLNDMLHNYHHGDVRFNILNILLSIGEKSAIPEIIKALKSDIWLDVRSEAARVLGDFGDKSAIPALIEALNDQEEYVYMCICEGCEMEHDYTVRESAIIALGKLGDKSALEPLRKLAQNENGEFLQNLLKEAIAKIES